MKGNIDRLIVRPVSFLAAEGVNNDTAVSSRIRLARNLAGYSFPAAASPDSRQEICEKVSAAAEKTACLGSFAQTAVFDPAVLDNIDRKILLERRLASKEFIEHPENTRLLVCPHERCSIMVNEEDQLRIQYIGPGSQLKTAWQEIDRIDNALSTELAYAFDPHLGYLTSCPTNVGTGMRASVMLHLPALVLTGQIAPTIQGVNKLHLAVRGLYGEGSKNQGDFFQISNQSTLGESEEKIIANLDAVIAQIIFHEQSARRKLFEKERSFLLDYVGRSYGILRHCYQISAEEALKNLSAVRLGVALGMFSSLKMETINRLLVMVEPAHLQKSANLELDPEMEMTFRADLCRTELKNAL